MSAKRIDGRNSRADRTRAAIVAAFLELVDEGDVRPSAERIAERAGVSERSIFGHFRDRETLLQAVGEGQYARIMPMVRRLPTDGPLAERLDAFVAQRAAILEAVTTLRRAAVIEEPFSETVAAGLSDVRARMRVEVEAVFRLEIEAGPPELGPAVAAAAEWTSWQAWRLHQRLSAAEAQAAMRLTLGSLLSR